MSEEPSTEQVSTSSNRWWKKLVLLAIAAASFAAIYVYFGDFIFGGDEGGSFLDRLAAQQSKLEAYQQQNPILVYGIAFLVYVLVTAFSIPVATVLTLAFGWYFGLWRGLVLVSFASTAGATLAFLFSRYLLRDSIQNQFGDRLEKFNTALEREGPFYLFTLRLIPVVPFFVINLVMGLTPIRVTQFWWISQLGMLAGTFVYVNAGAAVPSLETLAEKGTSGILSIQLVFGFVLLGLFPIVVKKMMNKFGKNKGDAVSN